MKIEIEGDLRHGDVMKGTWRDNKDIFILFIPDALYEPDAFQRFILEKISIGGRNRIDSGAWDLTARIHIPNGGRYKCRFIISGVLRMMTTPKQIMGLLEAMISDGGRFLFDRIATANCLDLMEECM